MKYFSIFSGIGGFDLALNEARHKCIGHSEIDKYATQTYEKNFGKVKNFGDCKKIDPKDLPEFDLLCGGFPCQDVSIAGRRDLSKGRSMLINDVFRIIKEKKPKYVILENVKGLLSMRDFWDSIKYTLHNLGYYNVMYKVLNSKNYGVPQNRERIFIVGKLGGWEFMEFGFPREYKEIPSLKDVLQKKVGKRYYLSKKMQKKFEEYLIEKGIEEPNLCQSIFGGFSSDNICGTIGSGVGTNRSKTNYTIYDTEDSKPEIGQAKRRYGPNGLICPLNNWSPLIYEEQRDGMRTYVGYTPVLRANMGTGGNNVPMVIQINQSKESGGKQPYQQNRIYDKDGLSPVLPSELGGDRSHLIISGTVTQAFGRIGHSSEEIKMWEKNKKIQGQLRRLTPIECERLQGFPDNWTEGVSDTQRYKQLGNAVTVNVVRALIKGFKNEKHPTNTTC